ncbi:terminase small subunit [Caenispirillum salinarum]|nr:terminase small subunit [Caenispirillum salinarum]
MTDKQQRFAVEYASNGGNATAAAKAAGYSEASAHEIGRQLLEKPHVHDAILRHLMRARFRSGAVGINALMQLAQDDKAPANARVSAARALCEHAGLLGTAKDMEDARERAKEDDRPTVDPREVLRVLRGGRDDKAEGVA